MTSAPAPLWQPALPVNDVPPGGMAVWKHDGQQIVLLQSAAREFFALDNRCPHEGYPLTSGDLKDCALTCSWHNWKFDVRDGSCLLGEEGVRTFAVREREGILEVDLSLPDPELSWPALLESFDVGLFKHQVARSARDGVRLLKAGYDPHLLLARIALYDARHGEYGTTHASPAAADCGRLLERYRGLDALLAMAPAIDMCGEANQRLPARPRPQPIAGGSLGELRAAVQAEEVERALGLLRGAFDEGQPRAVIESWMFAVLSDHFLNFGHPLIYMIKLGELFERGGEAYAEEIYEGLLYMICLGTREDTLPYMAGYFRRFDEALARWPQDWSPALGGVDERHGPLARALRLAVLDGRLEQAVASLVDALEAGASVQQLAGALVAAAAERFLRFDVAIDTDTSVAESWLWATHRLTMASAVRQAVLRCQGRVAARLLIQAVAFIHSGRAMDLAADARPAPQPTPSSVQEVLAAVRAKQPETAMSGALSLLDDAQSRASLRQALENLCLSDSLVRPIVVVHAIKTLTVAFEEYGAQDDPQCRALPVLATLRLLSSPIQERRVRESVQRSIDWAGAGIMPRKLTQ